MSEKSSLLSEDKYIQKRKNERFAYFLGIFTQFLWALNGLQLKSYQPHFPESFTTNAVVLWRSIPVMIIGYTLCQYKKLRITPHREVKHIVWFYFRHLGNYFCVLLNITVLSYFRLSTSRVFVGCQPLVIIFLSIIVLNETFYWRYLIGILTCLSGSAMIFLNDKRPQARQTILHDNIYMGLFFAFLFLIFGSFNSIGQKMMTKDKMPADVQNFYLGLYNSIPPFLMCIYERHFAITDIKFILYCMSNGVLFYCANYFTSVCYKYIAISKFLPVTYLNIVFTFLLSIVVLREPIFFTDVIGAFLIIGFQFYNITFPPTRNNLQVKNEKEIFLNDLNNSELENNIIEINRISYDSHSMNNY